MYVIDLTHFLDDKGTIAPPRGPGRKLAEFAAAVVAHASHADQPASASGPTCFKCRKREARRVETGITEDDLVVWRCTTCGTEGQISHWQGSFWDLSQRAPAN